MSASTKILCMDGTPDPEEDRLSFFLAKLNRFPSPNCEAR